MQINDTIIHDLCNNNATRTLGKHNRIIQAQSLAFVSPPWLQHLANTYLKAKDCIDCYNRATDGNCLFDSFSKLCFYPSFVT